MNTYKLKDQSFNKIRKKPTNIKRVINKTMSLVLAFAIALSVIIFTQQNVMAASPSEAADWARSQIGKWIDVDNSNGAQCVDLIKHYYNWLGVSAIKGNAIAYMTNTLPKNWIRIKNTPEFIPQPGDIAVWNNNAGKGFGHVAIVLSANLNNFTSVDQNWYNPSETIGSPASKVIHSYKDFYGVIRPYFNDNNNKDGGSYNDILIIKNVGAYPNSVTSGDTVSVYVLTNAAVRSVDLINEIGEHVGGAYGPTKMSGDEKEWYIDWKTAKTGSRSLTVRAFAGENFTIQKTQAAVPMIIVKEKNGNTPPQTPPPDDGGSIFIPSPSLGDVRVTDSSSGSGDDEVFPIGDYPTMKGIHGKNFDNKASRIEIPNGVGAVIFMNTNFGGSYYRLTSGDWVLSGSWDNAVSSIKVMTENAAKNWNPPPTFQPSNPDKNPNPWQPGQSITDGTYVIRTVNRTDGKSFAFGVQNNSDENGARFKIKTYSSYYNQRFYIESYGDAYRIKNTASGKYLEVRNLSYEDGAEVAQWDFAPGYDSQLWYIRDSGDGYIKFVNKNSGKVIDITNGEFYDGTYLQQWYDNGTISQHFKLEKVN